MNDVSNSAHVMTPNATTARLSGYDVHHDLYGWYITRPGEREPESGESLGFDGRRHFALATTAWDEAAKRAKRRRSALDPCPTTVPFTVVLGGFVEHVHAVDPRDAYHVALAQIYSETEPDPVAYPFDLASAKTERPLVAVFRGHLSDLSVSFDD